MTNLPDPSVMPTADPADGDNAGSQPSPTPTDPAVGEQRTMPDEAYKGLQRHLDRQQQENATLRAQIEELRTQPASQQNDAAIMEMLRALHEKDPAAAMVMAERLRTKALESEVQNHRSREQARSQQEQYAKVEESNLAELRATAQAFGADPASPMIDYGTPAMFLHERMARVRETARQAVTPATPVTPPVRTPAQAHNSQPGVPPTPRVTDKPVTDSEFQAALSAVRAHPSKETREKAESLRKKLMEQQLAALA